MSVFHVGAKIEDDTSGTEMLVQTLNLKIADLPPNYEPHSGWRILTGNMNYNLWARVVYRYEIQEELQSR